MSVSPFQKKRVAFQREKSAAESFKEYFMMKMKDMFLDNLPSDDIKAMSPEYLYPIGIIAFVCLVGIFLAVFLNGFITSSKTSFLSPSTSDVPMKNCRTISTINTGSYLATESGVWEGADGFQYSQAAYELTLTSMSIDHDTYVYVMNSAYNSLLGVKNLSYSFDLASNLVYWMSGTFLPFSQNVAQRFFFVGSPLVVFDRQKTTGTIANVHGHCNATSKAVFDANSGKLSLIYDYPEYMETPMCRDALDPDLVGYLATSDGNEFSVEFDIRSMITCVAVNLGIMGLDTLIRIPAFDSWVNYSNVIYNVSSYYDPKYSNMDPITCMMIPPNSTEIGPSYGYTQCIVLIELQVSAIPMFNHVGQSADFPIPCNCTTLTWDQIDDRFDPCNIFFFMSGVLFYPTNAPYDVIELFLKVGLTPTPTGLSSTLNADAYLPMWIDSYLGLNSPNRSLFNTPEIRESAYSFCNLPNSTANCTFMIFTHFDKNPSSWAISDYYYQVETGACQNTFVGTSEEWEALISAPFAPLTQDYQKCSYDTSTIIINQAGSSVGTVSILAPLCITFILVLVYFAQVCGVASIKKTYTNSEKADALADLALKLLLARDKDKSKLDKDSVLAKLVEELSQELESTDEIYHSSLNTNDEKVSIDWGALQTSVGLKKRQSSMQASVDGVPGYPSLMQVNASWAASGDAGVEMKSVGSPIHFLSPSGTSALKRENCVIMNDYEVTPALMQLCGTVPALRKSPKITQRKESVTAANGTGSTREDSSDDRMESGEGKLGTEIEAKETRKQLKESLRLDVPALFALMDKMVEELEAAQSDRSRNVWSVVSQSAIFRTVQVYALSTKDCATLYYKLYTLLALHAAAVLNVSTEEVKNNRASGVGYIVGNKVLTLAEIRMKL